MLYLTHDNGIIQVISLEYFQGAQTYYVDERIKYDILSNPQYYRVENEELINITNEIEI